MSKTEFIDPGNLQFSVYCPDSSILVPQTVYFILFIFITLQLVGIYCIKRTKRNVEVTVEQVESMLDQTPQTGDKDMILQTARTINFEEFQEKEE
jgi:hypothetical protein